MVMYLAPAALNTFTQSSARIESSSQMLVLRIIYVPVLLNPFAVGKHRIDAPMQEDSEFLVLKLLACQDEFVGDRFSANLILCKDNKTLCICQEDMSFFATLHLVYHYFNIIGIMINRVIVSTL